MSSPDITEAERQAVLSVLNTPNLSMGSWTDRFEAAFCERTGSKHAISVNSGTAGLHLCVRAAGWSPGDLVITTSFSFVASTNVLLFENVIPVFVDVEERSGNIDPGLVEQAAADITRGGAAARRWLPRQGVPEGAKLRGLLAVDVFGQPADLAALRQTADRYGLGFIEDSCEALGAEYRGKSAGTFGDCGVFAFYPNKQITTGEGGMIVTDDERAASFMRALRNQGRAPGDTWLQHTYLGYNYRIDEMSAALGTIQMSRLDELIAKRQRVADWYAQRLAKLPFEAPNVAAYTSKVSWFVYVIRVPKGMQRARVAAALAERGIPVRPYFLPIHLQPYMVERFGYRQGDLPVTEDLGERGLALPFSSVMTEEQVETVCRALAETL